MTSLTYRLYIDGTWQDSEGDAVLTVLNPATEEVIGAVPDGTAGDVNRAVAAARAGASLRMLRNSGKL